MCQSCGEVGILCVTLSEKTNVPFLLLRRICVAIFIDYVTCSACVELFESRRVLIDFIHSFSNLLGTT